VAKRENVSWKELNLGSMVTEAGGAVEYETGDWKSRHPVVDLAKCTKCGLCFLYCPEGCIHQNKEGYFLSDLKYCKGCGICTAECPRKAITMVNEGE
jgi:pyruvate ferredoxin oxidoreductase delta subunit